MLDIKFKFKKTAFLWCYVSRGLGIKMEHTSA